MAQDMLADGFVQLCIDPSLNFYDGSCRVFVEGQMLATGTAEPDVLIPIPTDRDLDTLFGAGSQLGETLKRMFCQCEQGTEIQVIPRLDPAGAVAAEYTLAIVPDPVTGVTEAGRMEFFMLDQVYSIDYFQPYGETQIQMATRFVAAVTDQLGDDFPYTVSVQGNLVRFVAKNAGFNGNFLNVLFNWRGLANYAPKTLEVTFTDTVEGTGHILPLDYDSIIGTCCFTCFALLSEGFEYQEAWQAYLESKWDCDDPQCFGHGYTWNSGTASQIIARGSNAAVFSRLAHCEDDPSPPWFKVGVYAALSCCSACDSPELSIQGRNFGVLSCLKIPESCTQCFTWDEQVLLRENAFVVSGPLTGGQGAYTSPYIHNDVTNYLYDEEGRPNLTFRDTNSRRLTASTAIAIATFLQQYSGLALFTRNTSIKQGIFGTNPRLVLAGIRAWAKDNVGILFSEFDNLDEDITVRTDFEVSRKCKGNPNNLHLFFRYRPPVRIGKIITTLQPKLLDNCIRGGA